MNKNYCLTSFVLIFALVLIMISSSNISEIPDNPDTELPYRDSSGENIVLHNNIDGENTSYSMLMEFLKEDQTEYQAYVDNVKTCAEFAVELHDNAEEQGIRCGIAIIHFENDGYKRIDAHAINVFDTLDKGMVYIDDTGMNFETGTYMDNIDMILAFYQCVNDTVAYVEIGQEYGIIDIDYANSFEYDYYLQMKKDWQQYQEDLEAFNINAEKFSILAAYDTYSQDSVEANYLSDWQQELEMESIRLDSLSHLFPICWHFTDGLVEEVELFW